MFVPVNPPPPSREAQDLGARLAHVVREYRQTHPGVNSGDVHQAFRVAQSTLQSEEGAPYRRAALLAAVVLVLGLVPALFLAFGGSLDLVFGSVPIIAIIAVGIGVVAVAVAVKAAPASAKPIAAILFGLLALAAGFFVLLARSGALPIG